MLQSVDSTRISIYCFSFGWSNYLSVSICVHLWFLFLDVFHL